MNRYESRGVRCLECKSLELRGHEEEVKGGFGWCPAKPVPQFVSFAMARNCLEFEAAPEDVVAPRDAWDNGRRMFWQR